MGRHIRFVILLRDVSLCGWLMELVFVFVRLLFLLLWFSGCVLWLIFLVFISASLKACKKYLPEDYPKPPAKYGSRFHWLE